MWRNALVTGASSGIGESFARLLAARGVDLVLVARRAELLESLASELRAECGIGVEVVPADLGRDLAAVEERAAGVELLINNAGYGAFGAFHELGLDDQLAEIALNVTALTRLTHAALPGMVERGRGGILNVASVAAFAPAPGSAVYGATKAYVTSLTESLHAELKPRGVHVTALCPGFTRTEDDAPTGLMWMKRQKVADAGLKAVERGRAFCVPGAQYKALVPALKIAPRGALRSASAALWHRAFRTHGG
ncbi:SDR family oxidoreductase [Actinocorallia longicatena]|uniref:SDR family oxidoreductase n=1 Tax=Actinocorallia longicatena TaxID=111803 RepID=A0ABP6Q555_9ACTN